VTTVDWLHGYDVGTAHGHLWSRCSCDQHTGSVFKSGSDPKFFHRSRTREQQNLGSTLQDLSVWSVPMKLILLGLLGSRIAPSQCLYLHRIAQGREKRTYIHASSGIRTHDPSVGKVWNHKLPGQSGHWDRQKRKSVRIVTSHLRMGADPTPEKSRIILNAPQTLSNITAMSWVCTAN
jgi:hypothetical protein